MKAISNPRMLDHAVFAAGCDSAGSMNDVERMIGDFATALGFEYYLLYGVLRRSAGPGSKVRATNYPLRWLKHYTSLEYGRVDPAAAHARVSMRPRLLQSLKGPMGESRLACSFKDDARAAGLSNGITVPLRTGNLSGFMNLNGGSPAGSSGAALACCMMFGAALVDSVLRVSREDQHADPYQRLTIRERQVLFWALAGKTAWETSVILGVAERTVVAHVTNSMKTMGCTNKAQLLGMVAEHLEADPVLSDFRLEL